LKDLLNAHLAPRGDEKYYQNPERFEAYKKSHTTEFAEFLGLGDTWNRGPETAELVINKPKPAPAAPLPQWQPNPASDIVPVAF
jgi:hypothetical protein